MNKIQYVRHQLGITISAQKKKIIMTGYVKGTQGPSENSQRSKSGQFEQQNK